jgi:ABC-type glycerol-3-phosphate transport system substrate-binding protein
MTRISRRGVLLGSLAVPMLGMGRLAWAQSGEVTISHYFTGELGLKAFNEQVAKFTEATGVAMKDSPIGHEDFKTGILVRAAGNSLPDVFSYWAGRAPSSWSIPALHPIDEMWAANGLDAVVAKSVADGATLYDGKRYLVPFGYHYAGMFYNVKVMADAGIARDAEDLGRVPGRCATTLKGKGVAIRSRSARRTAGRRSSGSTTCCCAPPVPTTGRS